jgi:type I restriction enzyme S subunit
MEFRKLYRNSILAEYPIEDVWEIKYGKNLPQIKITETGKYPVYGASGRIGYYEEYNYEFPVALVTSRGNGSGNAHRTNQTAFVTNNSFAFVPRANFSDVHFHLAEMILRELNLTQLRSGTAQPQLTIAGLVGVKLMLPAKDLLIVFNKVVDSVFELIFSLEKQNAKLIEARDILLPRLMSGQIEV